MARLLRYLRFLSKHLPIISLVVIYLTIAILILPGYCHQINPDGVGYLSVAHKYLAGHFREAVNGYWSPLISWLLVPLLALGLPPILAVKIQAVLIGLATILILWRLLLHMGVPTSLRFIAALAAIPIVLYHGLTVITPDLLVACAILLYLMHLTSPRYDQRWYSGLISGALGALAYLAKAYALPFVLAHFLLISVVALVRQPERRRRIAFHFVTGLAALVLLSGLWAGALSVKFHSVTFGSAGGFNHALDGPKKPGSPTQTRGLLPPPDPYAVSAWDDITGLEMPDWTPWTPRENRLYQYRQWEQNLTAVRKLLDDATWLFYPLMLLSLVLPFSAADPQPRRPAWLLAAALWLYPLGYLFLHVLDRFLAPMSLLLLVLGIFAVHAASRSGFFAAWGRPVLLAALVAFSFLYTPITSLDKQWNPDLAYQTWADNLAGVIPPGSRIASNANWGGALYLAYYLNLRYYGEDSRSTGDKMPAELRKHQIDYFFLWGDDKRYPFTKNLPQLAPGKVPGLRIYSLAPPSRA